MTNHAEKRPARPLFRKLALGVGMVCFLLAFVFQFGPVPKEDKLLPALICLFVGVVMVTISQTGFWPRPKP